eukprot:Gb_22625 [translate_table: standard]
MGHLVNKLTYLSLGNNNVGGTYLHNWESNQLNVPTFTWQFFQRELRRLYLHNNQFAGNIPASLDKCKNLQALDLSHNRFSGSMPSGVAGLPNLQFFFNLSWNSLQDPLPLEISKMTMVQAVDISGNRLTGQVPALLGSCSELSDLNLSLWEQIARSNSIFHLADYRVLWTWISLATICQFDRGNTQNRDFQKSYWEILAFADRECTFVNVPLPTLSNTQTAPLGRLAGHPKISYQELLNATGGFNEANFIGGGSFGSVHNGILSDGTIVAVKVLKLQNEEARKSFSTECKVLGRFMTPCSRLTRRILTLLEEL